MTPETKQTKVRVAMAKIGVWLCVIATGMLILPVDALLASNWRAITISLVAVWTADAYGEWLIQRGPR